ncbi:MAG TPA: potassium-transporting ATPase subunit KdpC [Acidobacteriota bacterium]|nr:potassium-transporting ATPase subunit KdpC [Acidobacteriota bacterium]
MLKQLRICLLLFLSLSVLTGILYPAFITAIAQIIFPSQANGSLIEKNNVVIGSKLIGQQFEDPKYFWSRPSATTPPFNAAASTGSNLSVMNPKLMKSIKARLEKIKATDPQNKLPVPIDLVTSSASGLDPHISIAAANYQKSRISRLRGIPENKIDELISRYTTGRFLGLLGEPVVKVLELNLALDELNP